jgi:serine/threonine protein kinase
MYKTNYTNRIANNYHKYSKKIKVKKSEKKGKIKNKYYLMEKLGYGSFSKVFKAKTKRNRGGRGWNYVAIKIFCGITNDRALYLKQKIMSGEHKKIENFDEKSYKYIKRAYSIDFENFEDELNNLREINDKDIPYCINFIECFQSVKNKQQIANPEKINVPYSGLFNTKNFGCIVLPYYRYSLYSFIKERNNSYFYDNYTATLKFMKDLLYSLKTFHKKSGKLHGDIKPLNVLIDESAKKYCFADFGSAICKNIKVLDNYFVTETYRPPERFNVNKSFNGEKVDVYSLGCTFFFILSKGDPLFYADYDIEKEEDRIKEQIDQRQDILIKEIFGIYSTYRTRKFFNLLENMLKFDYTKRFTVNKCLKFLSC